MVARRLAAAGLRGFEWAVGVPGSLGGAVRMNAGGHGSDMAACLGAAHVFDLVDGGRGGVPSTSSACASTRPISTANDVVVEVTVRSAPGDRAAAEAEIAEIVRWRRENQPGGQNAGSVFVNPVPGEVSAGLLIDQLGLRGLRVGTAWVSEKHANFIQASDGGSADDVRAVIEIVRRRVADATGIELRSEVRLVGFEDEPVSESERRAARPPTAAGDVPPSGVLDELHAAFGERRGSPSQGGGGRRRRSSSSRSSRRRTRRSRTSIST